MAKGDSFVRNHFVAKNHEDYMLSSEDAYQIQFQRLVKVEGENKYARAKLNCSHKIVMEIIEKYGLNDAIASRWEVWDKEKNKNVPFQD